MGSKVRHAHGSFCWAELATTDSAAAKRFYTRLLGWESHDDPIPGGGVYTMLRRDGGDVGALYEMSDEMRAQSVPPHWMPYVTVDGAADAARRAKRLGGAVIKDAFDVMDVGEMAVLQDPTGATFSIWQPGQHTGFDFTDNRPGTVCWNELATHNVEVAGQFYGELFGWRREIKDLGPTPYTFFRNANGEAAGMLELPEHLRHLPSHWLVYFAVADCDATAERARDAGAQVLLPPTDIPTVGRFGVLCDPQRVSFAVIRLGE